MTFSTIIPRIKIFRRAAMCSVTSATDHLSGAALKFHWATDRPLVASRTPCLGRLDDLLPLALSRSAGVRGLSLRGKCHKYR